MWNELEPWERPFVIFIVVGSIVDCYQFFWILTKAWRARRATIKEELTKEILFEIHQGFKKKSNGESD